MVENRKKLFECKGRICVGLFLDCGKIYLYIELIEGKLEFYVVKSVGIGKVDRDFI